MKQLIDVLYHEITSQIQPSQANIVRIEGIDNLSKGMSAVICVPYDR